MCVLVILSLSSSSDRRVYYGKCSRITLVRLCTLCSYFEKKADLLIFLYWKKWGGNLNGPVKQYDSGKFDNGKCHRLKWNFKTVFSLNWRLGWSWNGFSFKFDYFVKTLKASNGWKFMNGWPNLPSYFFAFNRFSSKEASEVSIHATITQIVKCVKYFLTIMTFSQWKLQGNYLQKEIIAKRNCWSVHFTIFRFSEHLAY